MFAGLASMASTAVLIHALFIDPVTWGLMRFVTGLCMAGLYVTEESWLNDLATNKTRGRLLSIYMVVTMGGMTIGQFLLDVADPDGVKLFLLASVLVSASLIPVVLSASSNPPLAVPEPMSLRELASIVPTGIFTAFFNGATVGVLIGLGAVYAVAVDVPGLPTRGVPRRATLRLDAAPVADRLPLGSGLATWRHPGRGVDRRRHLRRTRRRSGRQLDRNRSDDGAGGGVVPDLLLTIAYTADWLPTAKLTSGSAVLVRVNGVGALVGPLVATVVIGATSPVAYFWCMAAGNSTIAAYLVWRIAVADAPDTQRQFVAFPARASAGAVALMRGQRRRIDEGAP